MKKCLPLSLLSAALLASTTTMAADVRINGFASIVGGKTLSQGTARNYFSGEETKATFTADQVTEGTYDDDISFKPDSNYGIQISADLTEGLSVTGQITGHGGEDFDAVVSWAYISYDINNNWSLQAGRQRLPFYYYSDFIDVGYAYHWIRPPSSLAIAVFDTFEGVKLSYSGHSGNWDFRTELMGGAGSETVRGNLDFKQENLFGGVVKANNEWLQLRASYFELDSISEDPSATQFFYKGEAQATEDNPSEYTFWGLAAHMTFNNVFVVSEYTVGETSEPLGADYGLAGFEQETGWYISSGIQLGNFAPHITYGESKTENSVISIANVFNGTFAEDSSEKKVETVTLGLRWNFHSNAAAKIEYSMHSDKSDDYYKNTQGVFGYADSQEKDVVAIGVDVIF